MSIYRISEQESVVVVVNNGINGDNIHFRIPRRLPKLSDGTIVPTILENDKDGVVNLRGAVMAEEDMPLSLKKLLVKSGLVFKAGERQSLPADENDHQAFLQSLNGHRDTTVFINCFEIPWKILSDVYNKLDITNYVATQRLAKKPLGDKSRLAATKAVAPCTKIPGFDNFSTQVTDQVTQRIHHSLLTGVIDTGYVKEVLKLRKQIETYKLDKHYKIILTAAFRLLGQQFMFEAEERNDSHFKQRKRSESAKKQYEAELRRYKNDTSDSDGLDVIAKKDAENFIKALSGLVEPTALNSFSSFVLASIPWFDEFFTDEAALTTDSQAYMADLIRLSIHIKLLEHLQSLVPSEDGEFTRCEEVARDVNLRLAACRGQFAAKEQEGQADEDKKAVLTLFRSKQENIDRIVSEPVGRSMFGPAGITERFHEIVTNASKGCITLAHDALTDPNTQKLMILKDDNDSYASSTHAQGVIFTHADVDNTAIAVFNNYASRGEEFTLSDLAHPALLTNFLQDMLSVRPPLVVLAVLASQMKAEVSDVDATVVQRYRQGFLEHAIHDAAIFAIVDDIVDHLQKESLGELLKATLTTAADIDLNNEQLRSGFLQTALANFTRLIPKLLPYFYDYIQEALELAPTISESFLLARMFRAILVNAEQLTELSVKQQSARDVLATDCLSVEEQVNPAVALTSFAVTDSAKEKIFNFLFTKLEAHDVVNDRIVCNRLAIRFFEYAARHLADFGIEAIDEMRQQKQASPQRDVYRIFADYLQNLMVRMHFQQNDDVSINLRQKIAAIADAIHCIALENNSSSTNHNAYKISGHNLHWHANINSMVPKMNINFALGDINGKHGDELTHSNQNAQPDFTFNPSEEVHYVSSQQVDNLERCFLWHDKGRDMPLSGCKSFVTTGYGDGDGDAEGVNAYAGGGMLLARSQFHCHALKSEDGVVFNSDNGPCTDISASISDDPLLTAVVQNNGVGDKKIVYHSKQLSFNPHQNKQWLPHLNLVGNDNTHLITNDNVDSVALQDAVRREAEGLTLDSVIERYYQYLVYPVVGFIRDTATMAVTDAVDFMRILEQMKKTSTTLTGLSPRELNEKPAELLAQANYNPYRAINRYSWLLRAGAALVVSAPAWAAIHEYMFNDNFFTVNYSAGVFEFFLDYVLPGALSAVVTQYALYALLIFAVTIPAGAEFFTKYLSSGRDEHARMNAVVSRNVQQGPFALVYQYITNAGTGSPLTELYRLLGENVKNSKDGKLATFKNNFLFTDPSPQQVKPYSPGEKGVIAATTAMRWLLSFSPLIAAYFIHQGVQETSSDVFNDVSSRTLTILMTNMALLGGRFGVPFILPLVAAIMLLTYGNDTFVVDAYRGLKSAGRWIADKCCGKTTSPVTRLYSGENVSREQMFSRRDKGGGLNERLLGGDNEEGGQGYVQAPGGRLVLGSSNE